MRQRSGDITYLGPIKEPIHVTFDDVPEYQAIGVSCPKCEREAWLDRWDLARRYGKGAYLGSLTSRLRCRSCNNKLGNKWILGQLPR
jgi:hypothetical protein